jgi:hypothetical protein
MLGAVVVAIGMVALGLHLVDDETQTAVRTGMRRPLLRNIGQWLAIMGDSAYLARSSAVESFRPRAQRQRTGHAV